jgi:alanine dehydrogenase
MAEVLVLSEAEVAGLLDLEQLLAALGDALVALSGGRSSVPPRVAAATGGGILGAMPVHLPGVALAAILGAGVQGRSHLEAFPLVRDFREIRVASRTPDHAAALAGPRRARQLGRRQLRPRARLGGRARRQGVRGVARGRRQPATGRRPRAPGPRPATLTEVGEVLAGTRPGRTTPGELTVYKSTGHAVEDAAAADLVYRRALASGAGVRVAI